MQNLYLNRSLIDPRFQPMIPTFVFGWPTGQEKGDYLAVDLGILRSPCLSPRFQS